jgi:hypothetical protein
MYNKGQVVLLYQYAEAIFLPLPTLFEQGAKKGT